jgi:acyl-CoA thioester hydrolase
VPFSYTLTVQPADIDNLGHVSNLVYLRWVQEAALAHSTALGWDEAAYLSRGEAWVVRRHELEYLRPAMPGDVVRLETRVASMSAASSVRKTRVLRERDGAVLCKAATDWVYVELARARPRRVPEEIRARFPLEPDEQ